MSVYKFNDSEAPAPKAQARKGEGRMSESDLQRIMHGLIDDAETLVDGELSPQRAQATEYYLGKPFGNEEEGRSQVVITELRDTVHGVLPSLMKLFFGPERVVEYVPRTAAGIEIAEQATDYAQYVFVEDNKGFLQTYNVIKDGLVRKLGIFKWWWDPETKTAHKEDSIVEDELNALVARDDVELTSIVVNDDATFKIEYTVTAPGKPCIRAIPPEEFLFNRGARDADEALLLGHRTKERRGDLIAMGYDEKIVDEHAGVSSLLDANTEALQRQLATNVNSTAEPDAGEANDLINYVEAYVNLDVDGDGVPELRKVCMIGPDHYVVYNEPTDERPFAIFCPIPEPHTLIGQSHADLTMDIQLTKSSVARAMLDSLALAIFPRMVINENFVSVEDVLSTEIGAPIRTKKDGTVQPIAHPFTGAEAMPVLEFFDGVSESRVGHAKGAMSLDSDALQSSTQQAVNAAVSASSEQVELLARLFAEQAFKPLFRGIYRMLVKYKPKGRIVKLRGRYVSINASTWDAEMDVSVNVALGSTAVEKRVAFLTGVIQKQEMLLQQFGPGPDNPLTSVQQYAATLNRISELSGYRDPSAFFKQVPADWAPPQAPPQQSPEQTIAQAQLQIEEMKTQKDLQIKQAELQLKQQQQEFDQELEIRKLSTDFVLRRYAIDAQYKTSHSQLQLELEAAEEEKALQGAMDVAKMRHEQEMAMRKHAMETQQQDHDQQLAVQQQEHEQQLAQQQAAQQAATPQGTE